VKGYKKGQRVIAGAITPSGYSNALCGYHARTARKPHTAGSRWARRAFPLAEAAGQVQHVASVAALVLVGVVLAAVPFFVKV